MSGAGAPAGETVDARGLSLALVATRWHVEITDALLASALRTAQACGVDEPTVVRVAGAVELPVVAQGPGRHARRGRRARARPARRHAALRVRVRRGHRRSDPGRPRQPHPRRQRRAHLRHRGAGARPLGLAGSSEDKGREAALAALETALTLRRLRAGSS
jgi:6,7-dimethyl-8-ribityllumazine synthase